MWVHFFLSITTHKSQESRYKKPHTTNGQNFSNNSFLVWWKSSGDAGHLHASVDVPLSLKVCSVNKNNNWYLALSHWIIKAKMDFLKRKKKISLGYMVVYIPLITYLLWLLFSSLLSSAEQKSRCLLITAQDKVQQTGSLSSRSIYGCYKNFAKNTSPVLNSSKNKKHLNL